MNSARINSKLATFHTWSRSALKTFDKDMKSNRMTGVIGIAVFCLLLTTPVVAQVFPVGGLPMAFNGGFAGEAGKHRLVSSTRLTILGFEKRNTEIRQALSYD